jgi:elongation factor Ts
MQITASLVKELRERTGAGMMECKKALVATDGDVDAAVEQMRKSGLAAADKKSGRVAAEGLVAIAVSDDGKSAAMVEVNCETDFVAREADFKTFVEQVAAAALASKSADLNALNASPLDGEATVDARRLELVARIGENMTVRRFTTLASPVGTLGIYSHGGRIGSVVEATGTGDALGSVARDIAMHVAASRPLCVSEDEMPADLLAKEREIRVAQAADSGKPPEIVEKMVNGQMQKYLRETTLLGQPYVKDPDQTVSKYLKSNDAGVTGFARYEVGEGIERKEENFAEEVMAQVRGS